MSLKGFNGTITAKSAYVNAHVSAAGGKSSVVLPVYIQSRSCEAETTEGTLGTKQHSTPVIFLLSPIWIKETKNLLWAYHLQLVAGLTDIVQSFLFCSGWLRCFVQDLSVRIFRIKESKTILLTYRSFLCKPVQPSCWKKLTLKKEDDFSWDRVWSECEMVLWMSDTTHGREKEHVAIFLYTLHNECKPVALCRHKWINNICIHFNLVVDRFKIGTLIKSIWNHRMSFCRGFDINGDWTTETPICISTAHQHVTITCVQNWKKSQNLYTICFYVCSFFFFFQFKEEFSRPPEDDMGLAKT